jgi:hypothetical protein
MTPWEIEGRELITCTCDYGCNCQFNALPDKGHCHAIGGILIEKGHHGETPLDGLKIAFAFKWPGAIHEGNGQAIAFLEERTAPAQREALLKILTGQDTDPFATMFAVYASTVTTLHDPVFTTVEMEVDVAARKGRIRVPDYLQADAEPIRNPVTGAELRAQIVLPDGFEYEVADIGSGTSRTRGPVAVEIEAKYAQFARLHLNNHGVVRSRAAA